MKYKNLLTILTIVLTTATIFAQPKSKISYKKEKGCSDEKCKQSISFYKSGDNKDELFEQRIKNLKEKGFITEQEEKDLLDKINEVKSYRNEVWSDDKLTKEEQQQLRNKERELREKIREVLDRTREQFMEEKTIQEREKFFNEKVDKMLKDNKITKKQADELKKQHKELLQLEEKIWSDGVMTKEEQKNLLEQKRNFNNKMREIFRKEFKEKKRIKHKERWDKEDVPPPPGGPNFEQERGHFIPKDDVPTMGLQEIFEEKI